MKMKVSEMTERQKKAYRNICNAANWHIGGLENAVSDRKGEEKVICQAQLNDHDGLVFDIYQMAIEEIYLDGGMFFGKEAEAYLKDIRFCGKEWLMERVENKVVKLGY